MTQPELVALANRKAQAAGLRPELLCAIIHRESAWNPYAIRPESQSGFARRYGAAYAEIVRKSASQYDDHWFRFPDLFYTSYGLMQAMYPCLLEVSPKQAAVLAFPSELCDPEKGIDAGISIFKNKLKAAGGDEHKALLFWNGGGNPHYADEVLELTERYK